MDYLILAGGGMGIATAALLPRDDGLRLLLAPGAKQCTQLCANIMKIIKKTLT